MITTILDWLATEFNTGSSNISLVPLAGDASSRKYYRCELNQQQFVVMQQAVDKSFFNFIDLAQHMHAWGLHVPKIYKKNEQLGCLVLTDLGDDLYLTVFNNNNNASNNAEQLYLAAFDALLVMQKIDHKILATELRLPKMEIGYIEDRLNVFKTWFLQQHMQQELSSKLEHALTAIAELIAETYALQPQRFVHLDYHSRNLLFLPQQATPGIIDFQDAMLGPITYDLVSLLQDAYIVWPRSQVEKWLSIYHQRALAAGIFTVQDNDKHNAKNKDINFSLFVKMFDLVGVHRHLKNLGVFARLHHRDGKKQYLQHMPTLINYILAACERYPELADLQKLIITSSDMVFNQEIA